jgi:hypothetical protein
MQSSAHRKAMRIRAIVLVTTFVCALLGAGRSWPRQTKSLADELKLPAELAHYKDWKKQLESPTPVPLALWTQCIATTPADWAEAQKKHGPHSQHYIQVYANPIAMQNLSPGKTGPFQPGAIIAKEKLFDLPEGTVAGVAFMIKRSDPKFAGTGGWEFDYYPRPSGVMTTSGCASCHQSAAATDYVFGEYPSTAGDRHSIQTHSQ